MISATTHATAVNIRALEEAGIRAYVPLPDWDRPLYDHSRLVYATSRARLGVRRELRRREIAKHAERVVGSRDAPDACNACPLEAASTASAAEYSERVRG